MKSFATFCCFAAFVGASAQAPVQFKVKDKVGSVRKYATTVTIEMDLSKFINGLVKGMTDGLDPEASSEAKANANAKVAELSNELSFSVKIQGVIVDRTVGFKDGWWIRTSQMRNVKMVTTRVGKSGKVIEDLKTSLKLDKRDWEKVTRYRVNADGVSRVPKHNDNPFTIAPYFNGFPKQPMVVGDAWAVPSQSGVLDQDLHMTLTSFPTFLGRKVARFDVLSMDPGAGVTLRDSHLLIDPANGDTMAALINLGILLDKDSPDLMMHMVMDMRRIAR